MTSILIRDVPESIHGTLQKAADTKGNSLQQFLLQELTKIAEKSKIEEALLRMSKKPLPKIPAKIIVDAIQSERSRER